MAGDLLVAGNAMGHLRGDPNELLTAGQVIARASRCVVHMEACYLTWYTFGWHAKTQDGQGSSILSSAMGSCLANSCDASWVSTFG